eukprot:60204_1
MSAQQHATLSLQTNDVTTLFNKNDLSIESTKQLPTDSLRKPYDTKYCHSRSRSDSQTSFVTNHSDVTTSMNDNFQNNYKKLPGKLRKSHISKYRKSVSTDSTKIESLQLVTPQSYSTTLNTSTANYISNTPLSRDRALCGSSLIQQTRRHQFNNNKYKISVTPNIKPKTIENNMNRNRNRNKNKDILNQKYKYNQYNPFKPITISSNCKPPYENENETNCFSFHEWLLSMDILKYKNIFINEGFDKLGSIVELQMNDLREMNIPKGHCKMILRQVHNLQIKYQLNIKPINNLIKHQKQSYSDSIIPTIDKILSNECSDDDYNDSDNNTSCGFPDIDSSIIDTNKIYNHNRNIENIEHSIDSIDFHTFPRTSTNTSPFPLNINIKNNNNALKSLTVNIPQYT